MPPSLSSTAPSDRQARERERNRAKQQAYRDRQRQIRLNAKQQEHQELAEVERNDEGSSTTAPVGKRPRTARARPASETASRPDSSEAINRMGAKLQQLGVDQNEIDRLVSGAILGEDHSPGQEPHGELVVHVNQRECRPL